MTSFNLSMENMRRGFGEEQAMVFVRQPSRSMQEACKVRIVFFPE